MSPPSCDHYCIVCGDMSYSSCGDFGNKTGNIWEQILLDNLVGFCMNILLCDIIALMLSPCDGYYDMVVKYHLSVLATWKSCGNGGSDGIMRLLASCGNDGIMQ